MTARTKIKITAAVLVLLALLIVPAPLLPPHRVAETVQTTTGIGWPAAYLAAAVGLQTAFYGSLGLLVAFAAGRAPTPRWRWIQITLLPLLVVAVATIIRTVKLGHVPMLANAAIPIAACLLGVGLGLGVLYRGWKVTAVVAVTLAGLALWALLGSAPAKLSRDTQACLTKLMAVGPTLPAGETRFCGILQAAFAPRPADPSRANATEENRASILALGIAIGHERLAHFAGLDAQDELVRNISALRQGTTVRGRDDWARHYTLSAALSIVGNPLVSDAGGLIKEQLDALTHGSGFSFGDLAADRAGVRFAVAATRTEADARAMQTRLRTAFVVEDLFPDFSDLPENLSVEKFRAIYGGVGSQRYRQILGEIDARLDRCPALGGMETN